jgi:hypothetical protein
MQKGVTGSGRSTTALFPLFSCSPRQSPYRRSQSPQFIPTSAPFCASLVHRPRSTKSRRSSTMQKRPPTLRLALRLACVFAWLLALLPATADAAAAVALTKKLPPVRRADPTDPLEYLLPSDREKTQYATRIAKCLAKVSRRPRHRLTLLLFCVQCQNVITRLSPSNATSTHAFHHAATSFH